MFTCLCLGILFSSRWFSWRVAPWLTLGAGVAPGVGFGFLLLGHLRLLASPGGSSPWECVCRGPASLPPGRLHPGLIEGGLPTGLAIKGAPLCYRPPHPPALQSLLHPLHCTTFRAPPLAVMVLFTLVVSVFGLSRQRPWCWGLCLSALCPGASRHGRHWCCGCSSLHPGSRCVMVAAICLVGINAIFK